MWNSAGNKSRMFYDIEQVMRCLEQQLIYDDEGEEAPLGWNHIGEGNNFMQYTGLTDKNGKEIFEGDIVKRHKCDMINEFIGVVKYEYCSFVAEDISQEYDDVLHYQSHLIEIIGNIYETPELIK